jgi:hypothetical protein
MTPLKDLRGEITRTFNCQIDGEEITATATGFIVDEPDYKTVEDVSIVDFYTFDDEGQKCGVHLDLERSKQLEEKAQEFLADAAFAAWQWPERWDGLS